MKGGGEQRSSDDAKRIRVTDLPTLLSETTTTTILLGVMQNIPFAVSAHLGSRGEVRVSFDLEPSPHPAPDDGDGGPGFDVPFHGRSDPLANRDLDRVTSDAALSLILPLTFRLEERALERLKQHVVAMEASWELGKTRPDTVPAESESDEEARSVVTSVQVKTDLLPLPPWSVWFRF